MWTKKLCVAGLALTASTAAFAQEYLDLGRIQGLPSAPTVQVDLNSAMLGLATAVSRSSNPAAADLLANVEGVRVRVYSSLADVAEVTASIDVLAAELVQDGWQQVLRVQEEGDIRVHVRMDGESITGLTAMIIAENEAIFVNAVGSLTPEQLAGLVESVAAGGLLASLGQIKFPN
jgi:hypothetical protein